MVMKGNNIIHCEWGKGVILHLAMDYNEWELYRMNVDQVWPGRDNMSLPVLFKELLK